MESDDDVFMESDCGVCLASRRWCFRLSFFLARPDDGFSLVGGFGPRGSLALRSVFSVPLMSWVRVSSLPMSHAVIRWAERISHPSFGVVNTFGPSLHVPQYLANALLLRRDTR
jgi:hypothetical protein